MVNHRLTSVWLDRIWDSGIPAVEIFCARQHLDYHNKAQVSELAHWFADSELKLHSLHSPMYSDEYWGCTGPNAVLDITEQSKPRRLDVVGEIKRALEVAEEIPCRYLVQHIGVTGQEFDEWRMEAAFTSLEDISLFAKHRGVEVLLENIPNGLSTAERLVHFVEVTHLPLNFCFDTGHANMKEGVEAAFSLMGSRIRSTHVHDNNGTDDVHLFPFLAEGGSINWKRTIELFRSRGDQFPLLLELKDAADFPNPLDSARQVFEKLESL